MKWERAAWRVIQVLTVLGGGVALARLDWVRVVPSAQYLATSLGRCWVLAMLAMLVGGAAAVPLALLRTYGGRGPRFLAAGVIELVRATPELMVIFWVYFTLPLLTGSGVSAWNAALAALAAIAAASLAEIIRGGLFSVPHGQHEAARALGLRPVAIFLRVVLPQALRNMLPALIAQLVALFKTTSLVSAIGVADFFRAVSVTNNAVYAPGALYTVLGAGYFVSCWAITQVVRRFDNRYQPAD